MASDIDRALSPIQAAPKLEIIGAAKLPALDEPSLPLDGGRSEPALPGRN